MTRAAPIGLAVAGALAAAVPCLVAPCAQAQMFSNLAGNMAMNRQLMQPVDSQRIHNATASIGLSRLAGGLGGAHARGPASTAARTGYRRDPAVSAQVREQFADAMQRAYGPAMAAAVRADFRRTDPVRLWESLSAPDGFRPNDLSDALASYIALNWMVANGRDLQPPQAAALRAEVRRSLGSDPAVARMSEHDRQALAETLMCNFVYQQQGYNEALRRKDRALIARISDAAQSRSRGELGMDMRATQLTAAGVVRGG